MVRQSGLGRAQRALAIATAVAFVAQPARSGVLVVDAGGAPDADYAEIQAAVDAAQDGDVVLVRSGQYAAFEIVGKSVGVVADLGAAVDVDSRITVRDVTDSGVVLLQGLHVSGSFASTALVAYSIDGTLWVEDCALRGGDFGSFGPDGLGADVTDCRSLVLLRCFVQGAPGFFLEGGMGMHVRNSQVYVGSSVIEGGAGLGGQFGAPSGPGGTAAMQDGGMIVLAGSTLTGGDGGSGGSFPLCSPGGDGGHALHLLGLDPVAYVRDTSLRPGLGGGASPPCAPGLDGEPIQLDAGSVHGFTPTARSIVAQSPVRAGEPWTGDLHGAPGELAIVLVSATPNSGRAPGLSGLLLVGPQFDFAVAGVVPSSGILTLQHQFAAPPGGAHRTLWIQPAFLGGRDSPTSVGDAAAVVVLAADL